MENLRYMADYHSLFDTNAFLETFWKVPTEWKENKSEIPFLLKEHHKFWSTFTDSKTSFENNGLTVLEFVGGPVLAHLISATRVAKSITFADYIESNRNAVNSWINNKPAAHDWSSIIAYVLNNLENDVSEQAVSFRTQEMRRKIKPVVPCDITKYPIVNGGPFDVVTTSFCLEECSSSIMEYKANIGKLCEVLKPGGYLHMAGNFNESFYVVGKYSFYVLPLEEELVREAMRNAGMIVTNLKIKELEGNLDTSNRRAVFSISARKK